MSQMGRREQTASCTLVPRLLVPAGYSVVWELSTQISWALGERLSILFFLTPWVSESPIVLVSLIRHCVRPLTFKPPLCEVLWLPTSWLPG